MPDGSQYFVHPETGDIGSIPKSKIEDALRIGFRPATEEQIKQYDAVQASKKDPFGGVKAFGQALAEGYTALAGVPALAMEYVPSFAERMAAEGVGDAETAALAKQKRLELAAQMRRFTTLPGVQQELGLRKPEEITAEREAHPYPAFAGTVGSLFAGSAASKILKAGASAAVPLIAAEEVAGAAAGLSKAARAATGLPAKEAAITAAKAELAAARATGDAVEIAAKEAAVTRAGLDLGVAADDAFNLQTALLSESGQVAPGLAPLVTKEVEVAGKAARKAAEKMTTAEAQKIIGSAGRGQKFVADAVKKLESATLSSPAITSKLGTDVAKSIEGRALTRLQNAPGFSAKLAEADVAAARAADDLAVGADKAVTGANLAKAEERLATLQTRQELVAKAIGLGLGRSAELMMFGLQGAANEAALGDPALVAESAYANLGFEGGLGAGFGVAEALAPATLRAGIRAARAGGSRLSGAIGKVYPEIASLVTGAEPETIRAVMAGKEDLAAKGLRGVIEEATPLPVRPGMPPEIVPPAPVPRIRKALTKAEIDAVAKDLRLALQDDVRQIAAPEPGGLLFDANTKWRPVQVGRLIEDHVARTGTDQAMRGSLDKAIQYVADVRDRILSSAGLGLEPGQIMPQETAQKSAYLLNRALEDVEKRLVAFAESTPSATKVHEEIQGIADEIYDKVKQYGVSSLELKSIDRQANAAYSGLRRRLVDLVIDSNVWGKAGALEAAWREDARAYYASMENLKQMAPEGLIKILKDKNGRKTILVIDSNKMRTVAENLGSEKYTSFREALSGYLSARRQLIGNIESVADFVNANVGKQKIAKKLASTELAFNRAIDRSVDAASKEALRESQVAARAETMITYGEAQKARDALVQSLNQEYAQATAARQQQINEQINLLRSASGKGSLVSTIKLVAKTAAPVVGGLTLGPFGAFAGSAYTVAANPVAVAKSLAKLNKAKTVVSDRIGSVANALSDGGGRAVKATEALGAVYTGKALRDEYKRVEQRVQKLAQDVDALEDQQASMLGDLVDHAPNIADATKTVNSTALQYLENVRPKPPAGLPPIQTVSWQPIDADMKNYLRIVQAVMHPMETLELASSGALLPEQLKALDAVYPSMMQEVRTKLMDRIGETNKVPPKHRAMVSMLLGKDLDGRFQAARMMPVQFAYAAPAPQVATPKQKVPVSRIKDMNVSGRAERETAAWREAQQGARLK